VKLFHTRPARNASSSNKLLGPGKHSGERAQEKKNMVDLLIMVVLKSHIGSRQPVGKPS